MTTLTVNIDNKKSEKVVKAFFDALGFDYEINSNSAGRPLNKEEQKLYNNLKSSLEEIKLHQEGKIELQDAKEWLDELSR